MPFVRFPSLALLAGLLLSLSNTVAQPDDKLPAGALARLGGGPWLIPQDGHIAFAPDGKSIAISDPGNKTVRIQDARTGALLKKLQNAPTVSNPFINGLAFLPDGRLITNEAEDRFRLWDLSTGKPVREFVREGAVLNSPVISPDGKYLASLVGKMFRASEATVWEMESGKQTATVKLFSLPFSCICFSRDSKQLTGSFSGGKLCHWDPKTGTSLNKGDTLKSAQARLIGYDPDGKTIRLAGMQGIITSWDLVAAKATQVGPHNLEPLILSPDARFVVMLNTKVRQQQFEPVELWDLVKGEKIRSLSRSLQAKGKPRFSFSPDGRLMAMVHLGELRIVDVNTGEDQAGGGGHAGPVASMEFTSDGKNLITVSADAIVRNWDVAQGKEISQSTIAISRSNTVQLGVSPDGLSIWARGTGPFPPSLFDTKTKETQPAFKEGSAKFIDMTFAGSNKTLVSLQASGPDNRLTTLVITYNAITGDKLSSIPIPNDLGDRILASPDGKRVAVGDWSDARKKTLLLDTTNPKSARQIEGRPLAMSPSGRTIATTDGKSVALWDTTQGARRGILAFKNEQPLTVRWSPDTKWLAVGLKDTVAIWDPQAGKELVRWSGHQGDVQTLSFSPDGKILATGDAEGTIFLWDLTRVPR